MIIIHCIVPMVQNMAPFYVRFPEPGKVASHVNVRGINFSATPIRVHEDPGAFLPWVGSHIYHLTGEGLYFTTPYQAEKVFTELYGRGPDRGTELRSIELRLHTSTSQEDEGGDL
jgi:hypothetical protein